MAVAEAAAAFEWGLVLPRAIGVSVSATLELGESIGLAAQSMLSWPTEQMTKLRQSVLARSGITSSNGDDNPVLTQAGLLREDGTWSELGAVVSDLLVHEAWQSGDEVQGVLNSSKVAVGGTVLDVGCSTGWTLRQMGQAARRTGVDLDEEALALGYQLARSERQHVSFRRASAHDLPFDDHSFDCVICRNAITYTLQRRALAEMTRVLKPNGMMFLRFENYRYDLQQVVHAAGVKALCCRVRCFALGLAHSLVGWQMARGMQPLAGRCFGSVKRIGRYLLDRKCEVLKVFEALQCPRFLGRSTQTSLLARKLSEPS